MFNDYNQMYLMKKPSTNYFDERRNKNCFAPFKTIQKKQNTLAFTTSAYITSSNTRFLLLK